MVDGEQATQDGYDLRAREPACAQHLRDRFAARILAHRLRNVAIRIGVPVEQQPE
jgi:hypothetical protein